MSDIPQGFRPLDPGRVNLMDALEARYWCAELHCTPQQLEDAVDAAGEHLAAVRAQLEAWRAAAGARPGGAPAP
ncbi:DUF3606 domain-containing protein [Cupriavidus sp. USMAA2-4]|uniref:DUF3606 domain-containing protein n=1 Tax=Cupriavidus malaysiensis TaxID=367825 RepID=A0ABN4TV82_9BURK|nr:MULTISPECIES: DUF3606 domain-containing protein [Cupriavidus]AOY96550.1 DUF3606 domain-containing protein [Cupriavidus sp. USMAA2-4]AOZ03046.1 DUF3606 domain-containing protein [Cupriavidus sp. USMAHM13]AOZ09590.1 DUF3606 domain-containing protein [Cupriavidus malaysiensis]